MHVSFPVALYSSGTACKAQLQTQIVAHTVTSVNLTEYIIILLLFGVFACAMRRVLRFGGIPAHDASTAAWCVRLINAARVEGTLHRIRTWNTDARALCKQFSKESGPQCSGSTADGPKDMKTYLEMSPHYFCALIQADLLHPTQLSLSLLLHLFSSAATKLGHIFFFLLLLRWSEQVTEQIFIELMPFWKDGRPHSCRPDFTTHGITHIWRWKHLSSLSLPHICHHVPFFFYSTGGASAFCFSSRYIFLKQFKGFSVDCLS